MKKRSRNASTPSEILARIKSEEQTAYGIYDQELSEDRARALDYYLGKPFGNEQEARSQVISTDVADTVEAILPQLIKIFSSGDEVVRFDPRGPEDIKAAEQETEVINHIVLEKNDGFLTLYNFFKDALISKNGYVKVYWEDKEEVEREFYTGLTDDEFALLAKDNEVEIVEHTEYPDELDAQQRLEVIQSLQQQFNQANSAALGGNPQAQQAVQQIAQQLEQIQSMPPKVLHDVRLETKETNGCIEIESCSPESMMVAFDTPSVSLQEARFVQHREYSTIADLREDGFDVPENVGFDEDSDSWEQEQLARDLYGENFDRAIESGIDRRVLVKDTYMKVDGELMRYVVVGNNIIHEESVEIIPFAAITPVIMPHRHIGRSVADLVSDIQLIKSTLMRGQLDGMFLSLNPRTAISDRVNLDDMLVSRPGGVVRVQGTVGDALMPLVTPDVSAIGFPMLEYMDNIKEKRTGVNNQMAGISPDALNTTTATQASIMQNNAMERITLIARIFAETGVKEMFRLVHRLMRTHSQREMAIRLRNEWVTVDPRTWKNRYDMSVSVGLGTGSKTEQLAHLNNLYQIAMTSMQAGVQIVNPKGLYALVSKMTTNAGFKNPEEFWQDPSAAPPQPPQPNPLVQVEQMKQEGKQKEMQIQGQMDIQKFQAQQQQEQLRSQNDVQIEQSKIQAQMELERWKAELKAQTDLQMQQMKLEAEMQIEAMKAQNAQPAASVSVNNDPKGEFSLGLQALMEQQAQHQQMLVEALTRPKSIIRGPDGRALGVS